MLQLVFFIYLIIIFPFFINLKVNFVKSKKKLYFYIKLFGFIKILKGYIEIVYDGIAVHISKNKAIILPFNKVFSLRKNFEPIKDFHIVSYQADIEYGNINSLIFSTSVGFLFSYINNIYFYILKYKKPYIKVKNNFNVIENSDILDVKLKLTFVVNILTVMISFIKIFMEKLSYAFRHRKKQN